MRLNANIGHARGNGSADVVMRPAENRTAPI